MSLRWQFLIPSLVLVLLGLSILTSAAYFNSYQAVEQAVTKQMRQAAVGLVTAAAAWFEDRKMDIAGWADLPGYRKATESSFVGKTARRGANEKLLKAKEGYRYYEFLSLVGPEGAVLASSDETSVGFPMDVNEPYFAAAFAGQVHISDVVPSPLTGESVVIVSAPVNDPKKKTEIAGVLIGAISLGYFRERFISPVRIGETSRVLMFNAAGENFIHTEFAFGLDLPLSSLVPDIAAVQEADGVTDYEETGVARRAVLQEISGLGWTVIIDATSKEIAAPAVRVGLITIVVSLATLAILGLAIFFVVSRIVRPISGLTRVMSHLAQGQTDVDIGWTARKDEIGKMAKAVEVFKVNAIEKTQLEVERAEDERKAVEEKRAMLTALADDFEASVGGVVQQVSSAASQMRSSSEAMSSTAEETRQRSTSMAAASEQASANVQTVATAAEELSGSIAEISRQVGQASDIASGAVQQASDTNAKIQGLAEAAQKIGEVVELITDIAEQTNLLALNATIEAARAGDAGKGFAVVASEVKNLANQTAKATDEIGTQISGVQASTQEAVAAIEAIGKTIGEIDEISTGIASAVEEQGAATQEIARNVEQASTGTREVTGSIAEVSQAANDTGAAATQIRDASSALSEQSERLRGEVDRFLEQVRAA